MSQALKFIANPAGQRRLLLFVSLALALWASWKVSTPDEEAKREIAKPAAASMRGTINRTPDPIPSAALNLDWPERAQHHQSIPNVFGPIPQLVSRNAPVAVVEPSPVLPPLPSFDYKFMGRLSTADGNNIFLTDGKDSLIQTKVGQSLAGGWVLAAVEDRRLIFRHSDSGQEKIIAIGMH